MKLGQLEIESAEFGVGNLQADRIDASIQFGADLQSCLCRRVRDQIDDDVVTHQWSATPILSDVAEHAMLDLVPLAGSRREMAYPNRNAQVHSQVLDPAMGSRR